MRSLIIIAVVFFSSKLVSAQEPTDGKKVVSTVVDAANRFLGTLDKSQLKDVSFSFDNVEQRLRWSNLPTGIFQRKGLRWGDLNEIQRTALFDMIKATLSEEGVKQVIENMDGDEVLKNGAAAGSEGRGPARSAGRGPGRLIFGKDEYYISILGTPSETEPWLWQFGGHHLAINATIVNDQITLAPSLTGGQPVDYEIDGRKVRQLASEEDLSFALINSLSPEQLEVAVRGNKHADMIWGPGNEGSQPKEEGIKVSQLDESQRKLLLELVRARVGILNQTHASVTMSRISSELDQTWFSWYGPTDVGSASSFRIQGPSVLIEYAPQHMGGDSTNHTHAMYRDPANDYGAALIKRLR